ncbi:DUF7269 family protein [Natrinema salsiterrestre]|uniref:Uncharacterized protein n=1 Tax=Natrinema salsiterrestre TaxID=2950540 RepID=A0A9Q4Q2X5_9EURY|nr:hypothetical protein [Natrinema salsiterrestre]MDF9745698.1 hypothetical protein [Natrinema salsiterrestre]
MSRRSAPGPWQRAVARIGAIDPERVATVVVSAGAVLAVAAVVLGGFVPSVRLFVAPLYLFAVLLPVLGVVIAAGVCWRVWTADRSRAPPLLEGAPPEEAPIPTEHVAGREADRTLTAAARGWYRCRPNESIADVRRRLTDGAVRVLTTKRGLAADSARDAVRSGTWTDDPVAAAFLADDVRQPLGERLRAPVDPGAAHVRRVRRTLAAIDAIDDGTADADAEVDG